MDNIWSRSTLAPPPSVLGPGTWVYGASMALGRRVLASNPHVNLFHLGFKACDSYANGLPAMAAVECPVLFVLGAHDQMTQPRAAQPLIAKARESGRRVEVVYVPVGHRQMAEAPDATLFALRDFLKA
jgi:pimeloyl-ACP methyl ester carboxylesterase